LVPLCVFWAFSGVITSGVDFILNLSTSERFFTLQSSSLVATQ